MKIKIIGCESTKNEVSWLGTTQGMDAEFLDFNFHARPEQLHKRLQELIDQSQDQGYDLIVLTFSRCSNAVVGLHSPQVPLLMPRTHDCISLLLGSTERQTKLQKENPGTYYFSRGWLDHGRTPYEEYQEYTDRYGKEQADMLIEMLYGAYNKAIFIRTLGDNDLDIYRKKVQEIADFFRWSVEEEEGDLQLLTDVINGKVEAETVYVKPGQIVNEKMLAGGSYGNNNTSK